MQKRCIRRKTDEYDLKNELHAEVEHSDNGQRLQITAGVTFRYWTRPDIRDISTGCSKSLSAVSFLLRENIYKK